MSFGTVPFIIRRDLIRPPASLQRDHRHSVIRTAASSTRMYVHTGIVKYTYRLVQVESHKKVKSRKSTSFLGDNF